MSRTSSPIALEAPRQASKVLLHACCAPCASAIVEAMLQNGLQPTLYFCNPNIHPHEEYLRRKNECQRYAHTLGVPFVEAEYDHRQWLQQVRGLEQEPERGLRCTQCFRLRLLQAARYAQAHGFQVIATTLATSRWKDLDQVAAASQWAAAQLPDLTFWPANWRKNGLSERRRQIIAEQHFYQQKYCGCEFAWQMQQNPNTPVQTTKKPTFVTPPKPTGL